MIESESSSVVDPVLARVRPRWSGERTEHNLALTFDRVARRTRSRRGVAVASLSAGLALAGVVLGLGVHAPAPPVAARVNGARAEPGAASRSLRFDDGSGVSPLDARARPIVELAARDRLELRLEGGPARFDIAEAPARAFVVRCARVEVKLLPGRFVLTPRGDDVRVTVERGRAEVVWPSGRRSVEQGTSTWFPPRDVGAPAALGPVERSPEALMVAAEAARQAGHPAEAARELRRLLREHVADARAPVAAFTLGRILLAELERPGEAAEAFALCRRLAPGGTLAPDALAREAEASARVGDATRARRLAEEYLARYPVGPHAAAVRRSGGLE
jgi:hypothetical protein